MECLLARILHIFTNKLNYHKKYDCCNNAIKTHVAKNCPLKKGKNSKSYLSTLMFDILNSEIQQNSDYLYFITKKPSLLIYLQ